jgi:hypothetical protein
MKQPRTDYDKYKQEAFAIFSKAKSIADVRTFIDNISDLEYRDHTFLSVATHLAEQGYLREALTFCDAIVRPLERADAFSDVARKARNLDPPAAKDIFERAIEAVSVVGVDPWEKTDVYLEVSNELRQVGYQNEAMALVEKIVDICSRHDPIAASRTLAGCARTLRRWGNSDRAHEVAQMVEPVALRALVIEELRESGQG